MANITEMYPSFEYIKKPVIFTLSFLLKQWISKTILYRLVKEIETVDEALQRHGLADVRVGSVGLERLKKTSQILQVAQNIPTLINLIPFLELTSNQEYLVTRIKGMFIFFFPPEKLKWVMICEFFFVIMILILLTFLASACLGNGKGGYF
jgi:hypothetical protein